MKKHIIELFTATVLLIHAYVGHAAVNPITVTYDSGSTSFVSGGSGTANYVVSVNPGVVPANTPLTFHLTNTGARSGLTATQMTSGPSHCTNVDTLCGSSFSLNAGQSCCLAFTLTSTQAGNCSMQPSISTTPAAYQAKAASAQPINVSALGFTSIYAETNSSTNGNSLVTYSPDNGTTWGYMLSPQGGWAWARSTWAIAATVVNGTTTMYQATGVNGSGTCINSQCNGAATLIYSSDGITWNQVTNTLPTSDHQDWVQSLFAVGGMVYAGTGEGYVYYTNNQGSTWGPAAPVSVPDSSTVAAIVVDAKGVFYAGTQGGHIYYSTTSGQGWTLLTNQPGGAIAIQSLGIDTNGTLYVVFTDSTTTQLQYNTAPLTGGGWQSMTPLPSGNATAIAVAGTTVYVGTDNTAVMYTSNYGGQWNGAQLPGGNIAPIASLFVNQGPLSPLFVESYGIIPLNGGASQCSAACTVTVKNLSNKTVTNMHANSGQLPSGVTQQSSSGCASVAPEGSCFLTFSASGTNGFAPTVFSIIDNNEEAVSTAALVSSMTPNGGSDYYYVYATDGLNAYVVDSTNSATGIIWSTDSTSIWGIAENSTIDNAYPNSTAPMGGTATQYGGQQACNGATDGICDSNNIYIYYNGYSTGSPVSTSDYAAGVCYANLDGNATGTGEWYLPAACELNGSIYFDVTNNQFGSCIPVLTSISSLYSLGNLGGDLSSLLATGVYWSSTEVSNSPQNLAWYQSLTSSGSGYQYLDTKNASHGVRCSRALSL